MPTGSAKAHSVTAEARTANAVASDICGARRQRPALFERQAEMAPAAVLVGGAHPTIASIRQTVESGGKSR